MEIPVYKWVEGWEHKDWGRCFLTNDSFVTMLTKNPPLCYILSNMWDNGWEIYTQPHPYWSKDFNKGNESYLTTYKNRNLK